MSAGGLLSQRPLPWAREGGGGIIPAADAPKSVEMAATIADLSMQQQRSRSGIRSLGAVGQYSDTSGPYNGAQKMPRVQAVRWFVYENVRKITGGTCFGVPGPSLLIPQPPIWRGIWAPVPLVPRDPRMRTHIRLGPEAQRALMPVTRPMWSRPFNCPLQGIFPRTKSWLLDMDTYSGVDDLKGWSSGHHFLCLA